MDMTDTFLEELGREDGNEIALVFTIKGRRGKIEDIVRKTKLLMLGNNKAEWLCYFLSDRGEKSDIDIELTGFRGV